MRRGGALAVALFLSGVVSPALGAPSPAEASHCVSPQDCGSGGVCVAGLCRRGSESAIVEVLYPIAVPPPTVYGTEAWQVNAVQAFARQLRTDLAWSGFYALLSVSQLPYSHRLEGGSPSEMRRLLWQDAQAYRVVRIMSRSQAGAKSLRIQVRVLDVESYDWIDISGGERVVAPGEFRRLSAACVNRLIGHDTGLPGVVGSQIASSIQVKAGVKEVGVIPSGGGAPVMMTADGNLNLDPAWNGRGGVGYMSYKSGNPNWVVAGRPISARPGMNAAGAWSRDGRYLALSVSEGDNSDILIVDGRTGDEQARVTEHPGVDTSPSWSPDGRQLAFVSDRSGSPQIWIVALATGDMTQLTRSGYNVSPDWSPNGQSLAYGQLVGSRFIIKRHDFDRQRTVSLTDAGASSENPSFSADGRWLVFARRDAARNTRLWVMRSDGSHPHRLTSSPLPMFSPAWHRSSPTFHEGRKP
jgi:TolB protein